MASPNAPLDLADLNPAFSPLLNRYTGLLDQAGIGYRVDSGYRSPEQQAEIYARSNQGRSFAAAPAWRSFHNYGLAADVIPNNPADYARMHDLARQAGLYDAQGGTGFTGYDPPHVEMPGSLSGLINQYHLANWRPAGMPAPATGAIAYAGPTGPSRVATIAPGTTINSTPLDIVLHAESGDRNINNTTQGTSSGQAQGNLQITTGTWNDFAPKAGVDLKQYPTPDSAPRDVQIAVGNTIPLNRWAKSTVNAVLAKYPGIDTSQTLGQIQSAAINPSGASGSPAGGPSAPAAPGQPAAPQGGLAANLPGFTPNSPGAKMTAQGLQSLAGGQTGQDAPQPMHLPSPPPAMAVGGQMMMGPGGMNMLGRQMAQQAPANQYGFRPAQSGLPSTVGSSIQSAPAGGASGLGLGLPGTTLNSPSQLQMAMMYGSLDPSDPYGRMGGGMYGGMT